MEQWLLQLLKSVHVLYASMDDKALQIQFLYLH